MKRQTLIFQGPEQVGVVEEDLAGPDAGEVLVRTRISAISPGTELLIYRGQAPEGMPLDENIPALKGAFGYPFKYGYAAVGEVVAVGQGVERDWLGRRVFSFHPHESAFIALPEELQPIPEGIDDETACFLANMETAVNFVMDGRPMIGEAVAVFGLGIVGLLTAALLARFPLAALVGFDRYERRRAAARELGVSLALDPAEESALEKARARLGAGWADLAYELSSSPEALETAIALTGFEGRVVIGSWYGRKPVCLNLGGRFHRSRIQLISSQVSTLGSALGGRWSKARRMDTAWNSLRSVRPARWITHRVPFEQAGQAYRLLAEGGESVLGVTLVYAAAKNG